MNNLKKIRYLTYLFIVLLVLSGITAFPVETELRYLLQIFKVSTDFYRPLDNGILNWISKSYFAMKDTNLKYPFIAYGFDWLAFGHIVIALFFIPVLVDPKKYILNLDMGIIACIGVWPLAFIAGIYRGIPIFWTLIDCSFGFFGLILLLIIRRLIKQS